MTEKGARARAQAISAGLEHHDQVTDLCMSELHLVGDEVERRAQRPDHARSLAVAAVHAVADDHGIVLANDLPEVAGGREMVMQAAVDDQEHLAARDLAVDDARDVDAGLADEITPELDDHVGTRQAL